MPANPPAEPERIVVIDEKNMIRIWLEEKAGALSPSEREKRLREYEGEGKTWIGPIKDTFGSANLVYKLARDMKSWRGYRVYFVKGKTGDLVVVKGWPAGRKLLSGTRYKDTNPKIVELQIGRPGIRAAARESARFGIALVVVADVADYIFREKATLGQLLGNLTVDIPSVVLASAIGAEAGALAVGTIVGSVACGPFLIALAVGVAVGYGLYKLDESFGLSEKLGEAYDRGLIKLEHVWQDLGAEAQQRFRQLENSNTVHDLSREARQIAQKLGRESDWIRWRLAQL